MLSPGCIFCRIISGSIPCHRIVDTASCIAFLDINPLSEGHLLIVPKHCGRFLHDIPDEQLAEVLVVAKSIAKKLFPTGNYNLLQNNGKLAHQEVEHVHFHLIPKTTTTGLKIEWKTLSLTSQQLVESRENFARLLQQS